MKMSEDDNPAPEKPFSVEIAKQGRAVCKKCKQKCVQGVLRMAKLIPNPFGSGKMKTWYHVSCIFEMFLKQRQTTKRIEGPHDIEGWDLLSEEDKVDISEKIKECNKAFEAKLQSKSSKKTRNANNKPKSQLNSVSDDTISVSSDSIKDLSHKDNCFREFRLIVANVSNASSSTEKIGIFHDIFAKGRDGTGFKGDIMLWCKLLLPAVIKRVFHLQTKQLIKLFSRIFNVDEEVIMEHLDQGDVGQTIQYFFEQNKRCKPQKKSTLTIHEVDDFLETLTTIPKEEDQLNHFKNFIKKCTANDLKVVVRLIKHDLRMNAGAKHVFEGLHPDAYRIFQTCRDIKMVISTCWGRKEKSQMEVPDTPKTPKRSLKRRVNTESNKAAVKKLKDEDTKYDLSTDTRTESVAEADIETVNRQESQLQTAKSPEKMASEPLCERRKSVPNYFENIQLQLEEGVTERHAEWVRYFIAYGGTVLSPNEHDQATHVLHLKDTISEPIIQCVNNARHVIVEWIKDSVAKECLQDFRPYTVRWNPSFKD